MRTINVRDESLENYFSTIIAFKNVRKTLNNQTKDILLNTNNTLIISKFFSTYIDFKTAIYIQQNIYSELCLYKNSVHKHQTRSFQTMHQIQDEQKACKSTLQCASNTFQIYNELESFYLAYKQQISLDQRFSNWGTLDKV